MCKEPVEFEDTPGADGLRLANDRHARSGRNTLSRLTNLRRVPSSPLLNKELSIAEEAMLAIKVRDNDRVRDADSKEVKM